MLAGMLPGAALALVIVLYFWPEPPAPLPPEQIGAPPWLKKLVYVDDDTKRQWTRIIIHHSGTLGGNLESIDRFHRTTRKWRCAGYHFVIGNGSLSKTGQLFSGDGEIEVGPRWIKQEIGAHCKYNNDDSIGLCVIGNFHLDNNVPSDAQMQSLAKLCAYLSLRYYIPPKRIYFHREMDKANTVCPGKNFPIREFYRTLQRYIAEYRPYVNQMAGLGPD